ncbi:MAG: protein translocase subunit SecF [Acidobacteriota bacterium]|nr:protein translocase subunit SecF [Acidobacteriota bacterium]
MQFFKTPNIDFLRYKIPAFALSGILILAGLANIIIGKGLNFGVDFSGGALIHLMFRDTIPVDQIRASLRDIDLGGSTIQEVDRSGKEYIIRTQLQSDLENEDAELEAHELMGIRIIETLRSPEEAENRARGLRDLNEIDEKSLVLLLESGFPEDAGRLARGIIAYRVKNHIIGDYGELTAAGTDPEAVDILRNTTYLGSLAVLSKETVGPQVGADLRRKALQATLWALVGMLAYIAVRFKLAYGVASVMTLGHDVLITLSIFSFTSREINLPVIAALLTIVGYSLNDTIVIFDRVRDNIKLMRRTPLESILNSSINQTLSRSIITSGTVLLTVVALYLFGGEVINDFAFVMIIGVISGTYSTIYQSCPIVYFWHKIFKTRQGFRK